MIETNFVSIFKKQTKIKYVGVTVKILTLYYVAAYDMVLSKMFKDLHPG